MAVMKFYVAGKTNMHLRLDLPDDLTDAEYFEIADVEKDDSYEYVSIYVEFSNGRETLTILRA